MSFNPLIVARTIIATRKVNETAPRDTIKYSVRFDRYWGLSARSPKSDKDPGTLCLLGSLTISRRIVLISPVYRATLNKLRSVAWRTS
uniref:Uncharacterized protein n=1 Tax=Sinocyclocheilus grahami TaxID=75366 RepID=A0A672S0H7_SINGR